MAVVFEKPKSLTDKVLHYCPGCTHGIIHRLVAEVIDELGIQGTTIGVAPVGCSVMAYDYFDIDMVQAAHGRAPAVATGVKRSRILENGPVLDNIGTLLNTPITLCNNENAEFDCSIETDRISIIGMVSITKGYPISGEYGEEVADITLHFDDGTSQIQTFCNGIDVTTVFELCRSSRINPIAEKSHRIATFGYDKNFERYVLNKHVISFDEDKTINKISINSKNNGYALLIYGIYA